MVEPKAYLYILHLVKVYTPNVQELLENELLKPEIDEVMKNCTVKGQLEKELKKLCNKHQYDYVEEQVYFYENDNKDMMEQASLVIDVLNSKIIKNRNTKVTNEEMLKIYLEKYKDTIDQIKKAAPTNDQNISN